MKPLNFKWTLLFFLTIILVASCKQNQPPNCQIIAPEDGSAFTKGDIISISIVADDEEGLVSVVRLYLNEIGLAELEFPFNYDLQTEDYSSGVYTLKAIASDDEGLESIDEVNIIIDAAFSTITTIAASSISFNSALVGGSVSDDGGGEISEKGVYWDTVPSPETAGNQIAMSQGIGEFNGSITDLPQGKTIYYKAYAINSAGIALGEEHYFNTHTAPSVLTGSILVYYDATAILNGQVLDNGGETVTETGFYWSTEDNAEATGTRKPAINDNGTFSANLENLTPYTTFYIKAYAVNVAGESLGEEITFSTPGILSLQPDGTDGKDAVFSEIAPDGNWGDIEEIHLYAWTQNGALNINRVAIDFDLSSLPSDAKIDSAFISLYYNSTSTYGSGHSGNTNFVIQRITMNWEESTVSWGSQPATTEINQVLVPGANTEDQDFENTDLTELVRDMANDRVNSHGFLLKLQLESPYSMLLIASSDHPDENVRPKIVIYYSKVLD